MILDSYKTLVMEHVGYPGNIGDSCAETSRYKHLKQLLNKSSDDVALMPFVSDTGFLRHPTAPEKDDTGESWRETDFTSDQGQPLLLAARKDNSPIAQLMIDRIKANGYKTGNGDYVNPGFYCLLTGKKKLLSVCTVVQSLLLMFPYRWSDSKNKFEESKESSADYLNYIHTAVYTPKICRMFISKKLLKAKVRNYYEIEPNCQFIIDLYDQVIDKYY